MGVLDIGVARTPAQWHQALANANVPNPPMFKAFKKQGEEIVKGLVDPLRQGAVDNLRAMDAELLEHISAAKAQKMALDDLRRQIGKRRISAKDARRARDRIRREEMKLSQLLESITAAHEREVYVRDFPEDVLNNLYEKYPAIPRPLFPF